MLERRDPERRRFRGRNRLDRSPTSAIVLEGTPIRDGPFKPALKGSLGMRTTRQAKPRGLTPTISIGPLKPMSWDNGRVSYQSSDSDTSARSKQDVSPDGSRSMSKEVEDMFRAMHASSPDQSSVNLLSPSSVLGKVDKKLAWDPEYHFKQRREATAQPSATWISGVQATTMRHGRANTTMRHWKRCTESHGSTLARPAKARPQLQ